MRHAVLLSLMILLFGAFATTGCSSRTAEPEAGVADEATTGEATAPDAAEGAEAEAADANAEAPAGDGAGAPAAGGAPQDGELRLQLGGGSGGYGGYQGSQPRLLDGGLRTP